MTNREAIKILERRSTIPDDDASWEEIMEAINLAIKALEECANNAQGDLISRSALKKDIEENAIELGGFLAIEVDCAKALIDNAPPVESDKELYEKIETYKNAYRIMSDAFENEVRKNRPRGEWIPVSERRFPDDETEVLIQYGQSMMVGYHIFDHTIYPFGYEDEDETGWYDSKDNFICGSDEVIAWMPLPEAYKEAENDLA